MKLRITIPNVWFIVGLAMVAQMAVAIPAQGIAPLFPFIRNDLNLNRAEVGLISSAFMGGGMCTILLMGWLADRLSAYKVLFVTLLVMTSLVLTFSQVDALAQALAIWFILGMVSSIGWPTTTLAIMDWVPPSTRGIAMSIKQAGVPLGGAMAAGVMPALAVATDWRIAVISLGLVIGAVAALVLVFYHDPPAHSRQRGRNLSFFKSLPAVLLNRDVVIIALVAAALTSVQIAVLSYLVLFLIESLLMSAVVAGAMLAVAQVTSIAGRIFWGTASDLLFRGRRVLILASIGFISVAILVCFALLPSNVPGVAVGILVIAFGATVLSWQGVYSVLISELSGAGNTATTVAYTGIFTRLGGLSLAPLFGLAADMTGSYQLSWWIAASVAAAGTSLLVLLPSKTRHR